MMDFLADLMTPDAMLDSAYAWASNQTAHLALGVLFTALIGLIALNTLHTVIASMLLYAVFEVAQGAVSGAFDFMDSFNDWLAWSIGAGVAIALLNRRLLALIILIASAIIGLIRGVRKRSK